MPFDGRFTTQPQTFQPMAAQLSNESCAAIGWKACECVMPFVSLSSYANKCLEFEFVEWVKQGTAVHPCGTPVGWVCCWWSLMVTIRGVGSFDGTAINTPSSGVHCFDGTAIKTTLMSCRGTSMNINEPTEKGQNLPHMQLVLNMEMK